MYFDFCWRYCFKLNYVFDLKMDYVYISKKIKNKIK